MVVIPMDLKKILRENGTPVVDGNEENWTSEELFNAITGHLSSQIDPGLYAAAAARGGIIAAYREVFKQLPAQTLADAYNKLTGKTSDGRPSSPGGDGGFRTDLPDDEEFD